MVLSCVMPKCKEIIKCSVIGCMCKHAKLAIDFGLSV